MSSIESIIQKYTQQGIHSVLTQFVDIHGVAKGKLVPIQHLQQLVDTGAGFAGPSIWGTGLGRLGARSEYYGRVDLSTLRPLPFMPGVLHAVCSGYANQKVLDTCSRQVLIRQVEKLKARGWKFWVGIEPEFFLMKKNQVGQWQVADSLDQLSKPSYDLKAISRNYGFIQELNQNLMELGFNLEQTDHEDACGQYEINYAHDEVLAAADRFILFKLAAHEIAQRHDMLFSCMPKPLANAPGSGLHFHISITDENNQPIFKNNQQVLNLSDKGMQFAAGLLHHADALAAICAPTVNSYKRLRVSESASGTTWSPVWKAIGDNNRTCLLRAVSGRLEWRLPDPSCNVYAALAATIAAGLEGIEQQMPAPTICEVDLYEKFACQETMPERLPNNLLTAIEALAKDSALKTRLGDAFCEQLIEIKRQEWDEYAEQISNWELQTYCDKF